MLRARFSHTLFYKSLWLGQKYGQEKMSVEKDRPYFFRETPRFVFGDLYKKPPILVFLSEKRLNYHKICILRLLGE
jgi:hypothetical protein